MALIYIVEDDESIREIETIALKNSNYIVSAFENAKEFYKKLDELVPDLILLDVMLPDESGYDIVRKLRKRPATQDIPIIMVTAKTTEMDMIKGLDGGADDYIKKPFSIMELITRVKALLRRTAKEEPKLLKLDDLVIDHERHVVTVNNEPVDLTYKEYELLRLLMGSQGIVMTREVIMRSVWDTDFEGETRTVDMHIKTLRHKLGDYGSRIKTVRNVGYSMKKKINYYLVATALFVAIATMVSMTVINYYLFQKQVKEDLQVMAETIESTGILKQNINEIPQIDVEGIRVTWIDKDGTVLYDNQNNVKKLENHGN